MKALTLLLCLLALPASAQVVALPPFQQPAVVGGDPIAVRDTFICLIPDTQQNTFPNDDTQPDITTCESDPANGCVGENCVDSPFCDVSWTNTAKRVLINQAYDLTGQWSKIDWTGMSGTDPTVSFRDAATDHPRCDLIIGLGDITNNPDGVYEDDLTYGELQTHQREWDTAEPFWKIIKASGIPYILNQGNHDPGDPYKRLLAMLNVTGESFFYDMEDTRDISYAIKAKTPLGEICVVSVAWAAPGTGGGTPSLADRTFASDTWGCGASLPTIGVQHNAEGWTAILADAAQAESFAFVNGHVVNQPYTTKQFVNPGANYTYFKFFSNFQTVPRWAPLASPSGQGNTAWDGYGGAYTVIKVSPGTRKVLAWDWSPYFQSRTHHDDPGRTSTMSIDFDWDARYNP